MSHSIGLRIGVRVSYTNSPDARKACQFPRSTLFDIIAYKKARLSKNEQYILRWREPTEPL